MLLNDFYTRINIVKWHVPRSKNLYQNAGSCSSNTVRSVYVRFKFYTDKVCSVCIGKIKVQPFVDNFLMNTKLTFVYVQFLIEQ